MGLLNPLYDAVSWIIVQFHTLYSKIFDPDSGWAWGLSIVSLVIVIRICLIPLFVKQIKATRNMQALQPKMKAIQERYKSDRQRQSEEMMKLYKETGTNPFSSCLPILVQSPFFFALYHVLTRIANGHRVGVIDDPDMITSAREAHIFGAPIASKFMDSQAKLNDFNATLTDVRIVTVVMIVLMSLSQFITQRQLMTKNVNLTVKTPFMQQQKMLMYVFPIMFAVFGINFPVGVLVYWLTTNAWTMCQQLFVIRRNPTPGSKAFEERQERLKAKGKMLDPKTGKVVPLQEPAAVAATASAGAPVRRQQPKRQPKAKRQQGGAAGAKPQPGAPAKPDLTKGSSVDDNGRAEGSAEDAAPDGPEDTPPQPRDRSGGSRPRGQSGQPGRTQQGGQQRKGGGKGRKGGKPRPSTNSRSTKK
ncbi:membrane protein insertase YidC [Streptomyces capparidis]